jgi:hypothetical protein
MSIEGTWAPQMRNFTFWKKSWRERKDIKEKLLKKPTLTATHQLFFLGGGGGLGLPKFHVLSFWNWLEIRNQLGSWLLKQQQQGRNEEENTHNHHNTKEGPKKHSSLVGTHCSINDAVYVLTST